MPRPSFTIPKYMRYTEAAPNTPLPRSQSLFTGFSSITLNSPSPPMTRIPVVKRTAVTMDVLMELVKGTRSDMAEKTRLEAAITTMPRV